MSLKKKLGLLLPIINLMPNKLQVYINEVKLKYNFLSYLSSSLIPLVHIEYNITSFPTYRVHFLAVIVLTDKILF